MNDSGETGISINSTEALKRFLNDKGLISNPNSDLEIRQYPGGFSNLTYRLSTEGKTFVLRRPPAGAVKRGHDMAREFKVLSGLYPMYGKVPKPLEYTGDAGIIGAPFYMMEEVEGIILYPEEANRRDIPPDEFRVIADQWLSSLVELHSLDYKLAGLEELGRPEGYVERQVSNWSKQYLKAATESIPEADKVMKWMQDHQPTTFDHCLIHNDYKYDNVIFADNSWKEIRAILDWEMCTLGDPLMDLGTSLAYWVLPEDPPKMLRMARSATIMMGNPSRSQIVEMYAEKSGRTIRHLTFYYVYGLFKIAVIVQQIYYRYKAGLSKDKRFASLNAFTRILCERAWRAVQRKSID